MDDLTAATWGSRLVISFTTRAPRRPSTWCCGTQKVLVYKPLGGARAIVTDITISVNPQIMGRAGRHRARVRLPQGEAAGEPALGGLLASAVNACIRIDATRPMPQRSRLNPQRDVGEALAIELVSSRRRPVTRPEVRHGAQRCWRTSVFEDAMRIAGDAAADLINIKLMKCGGLENASKIASAADPWRCGAARRPSTRLWSWPAPKDHHEGDLPGPCCSEVLLVSSARRASPSPTNPAWNQVEPGRIYIDLIDPF